MPSSARSITPRWAARGTELPLEAKSKVVLRGWEEAALGGYSSQDFASDLHAIGLPSEDVGTAIDTLWAGRSEVRHAESALWKAQEARWAHYFSEPPGLDAAVDEARQNLEQVQGTALRRLRDWFAGRQIVVDARQLVEVRLPLFVLAAAAETGCSATYKTTSERGRGLGWTVDIAGTGMGGDATVTSSVTSTFTAEARQGVLVFLPVTVAIEDVRVTAADGATLGSGHRIDVAPARRKRPVPGALLLDHQALPRPDRRPVQTYPLAGYGPGVPASYEYIHEQTRRSQLKIGVKAAGVGLSVTGEARMNSAITLTYVLVGGRDYQLYRTARGEGLVWA
jgi:hypothetical protein